LLAGLALGPVCADRAAGETICALTCLRILLVYIILVFIILFTQYYPAEQATIQSPEVALTVNPELHVTHAVEFVQTEQFPTQFKHYFEKYQKINLNLINLLQQSSIGQKGKCFNKQFDSMYTLSCKTGTKSHYNTYYSLLSNYNSLDLESTSSINAASKLICISY